MVSVGAGVCSAKQRGEAGSASGCMLHAARCGCGQGAFLIMAEATVRTLIPVPETCNTKSGRTEPWVRPRCLSHHGGGDGTARNPNHETGCEKTRPKTGCGQGAFLVMAEATVQPQFSPWTQNPKQENRNMKPRCENSRPKPGCGTRGFLIMVDATVNPSSLQLAP